jgi:predicted GIY-YIG superfamily endonuclease
MGNKKNFKDGSWEFPFTKLGYHWELYDGDGDLIGRSAMSFQTERACRENAFAHSRAKPPVIDEQPEEPPLDVDDIRANIRMLKEWRVSKEQARLAGFAEGVASSFKHPVGQRGVPPIWYVYILESKRRKLLILTGPSVPGRIIKLHGKSNSGVVSQAKKLVWCERHNSEESAISRQTEMREWSRDKKIGFIEASNPSWNDISESQEAR